MADDIITLRVNGAYHDRWMSVSVTRGIEQLAGTFDFTITDQFAGASDLRAIKPGMQVQALINDDELICTGYIDEVGPAYDEHSHALRISGRDKTQDLVDCSAIYKTGQWSGRTLAQIAADLLAPFDININLAADTGAPFATFSIQEGETVFETLQRAARMRAVLLNTDEAGNLVITRAGTGKIATELTEGTNIEGASARFSWRDRFSHYIVKGQSRGDDHNYAIAAAGASATADDATINRYRPMIVHAEHHDGSTLAARATWEANMRIGRGNRGSVRVKGWSHADGAWRPNKLVHVDSPMLNLDADMLIVSCHYFLDRSGTQTVMEIACPDAFDLLAGVGVSKLGSRKLTERDKRQKVVQGDDWSGL